MIRPLARRVRNRLLAFSGPSALILTYHRVAELQRDPQLLSVRPDNFEKHIEALAARYQVVSLDHMVESLRGGHIEDRTVAVTFDDGYADNLTTARPVLEAYNAPATVFISSGYLDGTREFWWDELERIVLSGDDEPRWNVLEPPKTDRQREYVELDCEIHRLAAPERERALESARLRRAAPAAVRPSHRPMTAEEVAALDASALVDVGAHSRDHVVLAELPAQSQRESITSDKSSLEGICGRPITLFSYPYGGPGDFTAETVAILRDAGMHGACANYPGLVKRWTDPYRLPRYVVRDWSAESLIARVEAWFAGTEVRP